MREYARNHGNPVTDAPCAQNGFWILNASAVGLRVSHVSSRATVNRNGSRNLTYIKRQNKLPIIGFRFVEKYLAARINPKQAISVEQDSHSNGFPAWRKTSPHQFIWHSIRQIISIATVAPCPLVSRDFRCNCFPTTRYIAPLLCSPMLFAGHQDTPKPCVLDSQVILLPLPPQHVQPRPCG